ncbi:hypothetical protein OMP43_03750 [Sphingomonas sp. CBMAI 2297]|uniref:hypothetical protein n=1 Tax=Sphingomonas sp. CBMAI 2297 TaxID=2991720 RepID=UPI002457F1C5|nr:hypothetical protein [Sphingomonas sp. CBMAI 2297]MDH4743129.1 hypothetical protein [Sphingomonas sp. CBMAI 2297]
MIGAHYKRWQPAELQILREEYPRGGYKHVGRLLPHRSLDTIRMRASALGIRAPRRIAA